MSDDAKTPYALAARPQDAVGNRIEARDPLALRRALDRFGPTIERLWAPRASGAQHLAGPGAAVVVGNHSGGPLAMFEPLVLAHATRAVGEAHLPTLLLHEVMWKTPLGPWLERTGAMRASPPNANALLRAGRKVLVYPGGDREPFRHHRDRDRVQLGDRRGYVRLAIEHGVPVVPVVTAGMHSGFVCLGDGHALARRFPLARKLRVGVLPITLSFPFGLWVGLPPPYLPLWARVRISVLPPIHFPRTGAAAAEDAAYVEACHAHVETTMQCALDARADERRRERRWALYAYLDRALSFLERLTLAPRAATRVAALPAASADDRTSRTDEARLAIVTPLFARPSAPSTPPGASAPRRAA